MIYIGIAFFTEDALIALMELTRQSVFLVALLALLPLNSAGRIVIETRRFLLRQRTVSGDLADVPPGTKNAKGCAVAEAQPGLIIRNMR